MNVCYYKFKDGGCIFKVYVVFYGDYYDLWIVFEDFDCMIIGDDGGVQVIFDGGENWIIYYN